MEEILEFILVVDALTFGSCTENRSASAPLTSSTYELGHLLIVVDGCLWRTIVTSLVRRPKCLASGSLDLNQSISDTTAFLSVDLVPVDQRNVSRPCNGERRSRVYHLGSRRSRMKTVEIFKVLACPHEDIRQVCLLLNVSRPVWQIWEGDSKPDSNTPGIAGVSPISLASVSAIQLTFSSSSSSSSSSKKASRVSYSPSALYKSRSSYHLCHYPDFQRVVKAMLSGSN